MLANYIEMLAKKHINSLILLGAGGYGKSYTVVTKLNQLNAKYEYRSGYLTPLELYHDLYYNQNKIIVYDDVENLLSDIRCVSILRPATWEVNNKRTIHYASNTDKLRVPSSFEFNGQIILILNEIPNKSSKSIKALIDRSVFYEIKMNYEEKLKFLKKIAKEPYKKLTNKQRIEVYDFIAKNTDNTTKDLSARTLTKAFDFYLYDKNNWRKYLKPLLEKDEEMSLINELIKKHGKIETAMQDYCALTGHHRATFYRKKNKL